MKFDEKIQLFFQIRYRGCYLISNSELLTLDLRGTTSHLPLVGGGIASRLPLVGGGIACRLPLVGGGIA